jgi:GT2 family glycosyltransferase
VLRVSEAARRVVHVPRVLCHRPAPFAPSSRWVKDASDVLNGHFRRTGAQLTAVGDQPGGVQRDSVVVRANLRYAPSVSIIIPTAGVVRRIGSRTVPLVVNCVESIVERSTYASFDIVCVFDKPIDPGVRRALEHAAGDRIKLLPYEDTFNFARKVNVGALASTSEHLLFLNDDIEVSTPEWIEELFAYSTNPRVGAVGALLRFGDGRIQHAGVVLSGGHPGHSYYGFPGDHPGYHSNLRAASNITAVTAACLMTRRECFERVGGLSVAFPRNYNDVDFCLKLGAAGYRIVLNPRAQLLHYESSSRGFLPVEPEELELLQNRWGTRLLRDPYYNPNFLPGADFVTLVDPLGRTPAEAGLV